MPDLFPVTVDTHGRPNILADAMHGQALSVISGGRKHVMIIDHVEQLEANAVRAWCRWPGRLSLSQAASRADRAPGTSSGDLPCARSGP